jgi:hypothetical protein
MTLSRTSDVGGFRLTFYHLFHHACWYPVLPCHVLRTTDNSTPVEFSWDQSESLHVLPKEEPTIHGTYNEEAGNVRYKAMWMNDLESRPRTHSRTVR